ncbi:hypothetical protein [Tateyamaria sp. syn59]|uniref:hypothetical protein n=1 Tax=Tateyamaria sp. syn59 TaxID=2576942 RepID=UPI00167905CF|nr:hypothetical protein [Tateyamaria sp. syn59]
MSGVLAKLTDDLSTVTHLVSELTTLHGNALPEAHIQKLQKLDHIGQSLHDLSIISAILAEVSDGERHQDAQLKLAESRAILSSDSCATVSPVAGSIELF